YLRVLPTPLIEGFDQRLGGHAGDSRRSQRPVALPSREQQRHQARNYADTLHAGALRVRSARLWRQRRFVVRVVLSQVLAEVLQPLLFGRRSVLLVLAEPAHQDRTQLDQPLARVWDCLYRLGLLVLVVGHGLTKY